MRSYRGSISIYFTFAIVLIISIILSITEIARINCQKLYLQIATDASVDSMLSLYNRKLHEYYSLYGVEYMDMDSLEEEYLEYLDLFFRDDEVYLKNWYTALIDTDNINLKIKLLTEDTNLENEIVNYMKYKLIGKTIEFLGSEIVIKEENDEGILLDEAKNIFEKVEKNDVYGVIYERYFNFVEHINELENYARKIVDYVNKINIGINGMKVISVSGSLSNVKSCLNKLEQLISKIDSLKSNLISYKNKMNDFRNVVLNSKNRYEQDVLINKYEYSDEVCEFIETEFRRFISYVDESSEMNQQVDEGITSCESMRGIVKGHYEGVKGYVRELEYIDECIKEERKQKGEDRDEDAIKELNEERKAIQDDASDYLTDIREDYKELKMDKINVEVSETNHKSEENLLKRLIGLKNNGISSLVLDTETLSKIDSNTIPYNSFNIMSDANTISLEKVLLGEYELDKLNYFNKDKNSEITISGSKKLEVERLISGKMSDTESLNNVISRIFAIRIAMNVLHIYESSEKRELARDFTTTLFGGISPLLAEAMFLLVITAWGTAQGIVDMRRIMANNKVNFIHDDRSWTVSVDSILNIAGQKMFNREEDKDDMGFALSYKDYLRILLFTEKQSNINARLASIIEYNIQKEQESFELEKTIYSFDVENSFRCRHYFTNLVFITAKNIKLYDEYSLKTNSYRSYYDSKR